MILKQNRSYFEQLVIYEEIKSSMETYLEIDVVICEIE